MRDIRITQQRLVTPNVRTASAPAGNAALFDSIGSFAEKVGSQIKEQADRNYRLRLDTELHKEIQRIENENIGNPSRMQAAFDEYHETLLESIDDKNLQAEISNSLTKNSLTRVNRALRTKRVNMDNEALEASTFAIEKIQNTLNSVAPEIFSLDPEVSAAAVENAQDSIISLQKSLNILSADGTPLYSGEKQAKIVMNARDSLLSSGVISYIRNAENPQEALSNFREGNLRIALPDGQGGEEIINVRDVLPENIRSALTVDIERAEKKALADQRKQQDLTVSSYDLEIETVTDDPNGMTAGQKLLEIAHNIDSSELLGATPEGQRKANGLRKKLFKKLQDESEREERRAQGALFASGQLKVNGQDRNQVDAFNEYYESVVPSLDGLDPNQRNMVISKIITGAGSVPRLLKGDIKNAAASQDTDTIVNAANLVQAVVDKNPHLLGQLGSERDISRIEMINKRINIGYVPREAVSIVDEQLKPANLPTVAKAAEELQDEEVEYRAKAIQAFDSAGIFKEVFTFGIANGLDEEGVFNQQTIDRVSAYYRVAYEDAYKMTRDHDQAEEIANRRVNGLYGVSKTNGSTQIMQFPPERYFSIEEEDNDWMRPQFLEETREVFRGSLSGVPSLEEVEERAVLVVDPAVTPRTAAEGNPHYKIMYKHEDGTYYDLLGAGNYFTFSPEKRRQELIDEARKDADQ